MKKRAEKDTRKAKETKSTEKESPMEHRYDIPDELEEIDEEDEDEESSKIQELNDKYLRLYSEFDNYRRRTLQEKIELSKTASAGIITELLPILDDFDRAMKAFSETTTADASLKDGIVLIYTKFLNLLTQKGLQQMKTIGEP